MPVLVMYLVAAVLLLATAGVVFRLFVRRDYRRKGRLTALSSMLETVVFFAYGGFPSIYLASDWPAVYVHPILKGVALLLVAVGLGIVLVGIVKLGILRSLGQGKSELKQSGMYRLSRNPQALGCALYVIGFAVLWPSWYAVGWALMYAPIIHMMVLAEEEYLRGVHSEAYDRYCERVPRYLGFARTP